MKILDLAKYCEDIKLNCNICKNKESCEKMADYLEDQSPYGVVKMIRENEEF